MGSHVGRVSGTEKTVSLRLKDGILMSVLVSVSWQRTTVHMAAGLTPWLACELPDDPSQISAEMLTEWKKKQRLAGLAAKGCNVLFEEIGLRRRMNFYYEFKKSSEWKNLGFLKTVRMGKEILKKDVSK